MEKTNSTSSESISSRLRDSRERVVNALKSLARKKESSAPELEIQKGLKSSERSFFPALDELQLKIMLRDASRLKAEGRLKPFQPLEMQVQTPQMCGYSASAMTERLRDAKGVDSAQTVYGHLESGDRPYHYWTEISVSNRNFLVCGTYGQFDRNYKNRILFVNAAEAKKYALQKYVSGGSEQDDETTRVLNENGGILPIEESMEAGIREGYEKLKSSLVI